MEQNGNNNILIHACCGICSGYPISMLKDLGYSVTVFFCNPNIATNEEFNKRLEAQKKVCENFNVPLIIENYNHTQYLDYVKGYELEPERGLRCDKCIELRLNEAAKKTSELGYRVFTTSLVISPHKNFQKITEIGEKAANKYNIKYLAIDFKKKDGFLKTNKISKELNIYRQNYCGCEFAKTKS